MENDVPVLEVPLEPGKNVCKFKMRRFINHLAGAAGRAEEKSRQKAEIKSRIEHIKNLSLNKRSTKQEIESELGNFENVVREIINDEEKILEEQRKGTKQINELKSMVEMLSKKLISLGGDYSEELESRDSKILELREALASANIKLSDSNETRAEKIKNIERKVKQGSSEKVTHSDIKIQLSMLEKKHRELSKSGEHSKKDLDRIKKLIENHKKTISKL